MNYTSPSYMNTSQESRGKSSGWAAFDRKQRQKQGSHQAVPGDDPYPPITTTLHPCGNLARNSASLTRPFSSVLLPAAVFPALTENTSSNQFTEDDVSSKYKDSRVKNRDALSKLKELHSWADCSLIVDVMANVNNDFEKASALLKSMVSADTKENSGRKYDTVCNDFQQEIRANDRDFPGEGAALVTGLAAEIADLSATLEDALKDNHKEFSGVDASSGERLSDDAAANMKLILGHLRSAPTEPEWEEDDVYLTHRKDALRMMRLASRHSRAAANAFLRGDHLSAQQHSLKAREGWASAEQLNSKAAEQILKVRNNKNDPWKLDLHGLHAGEAIQALQDHLLRIETQVPIDRPSSSNRINMVNGIERSSLHHSLSRLELENLDKKQTAVRQRPSSLQIITGVGNHSRGEAALPSAVRSFLNENRYRFDETRPGVITVRPKFRLS